MSEDYLSVIEGLSEFDDKQRSQHLGDLTDMLYGTDESSPNLVQALNRVAIWIAQEAKDWDAREIGLNVLLMGCEKGLLAGVDLSPLDALYPSLDKELQGYVDDIREGAAEDNAAALKKK